MPILLTSWLKVILLLVKHENDVWAKSRQFDIGNKSKRSLGHGPTRPWTNRGEIIDNMAFAVCRVETNIMPWRQVLKDIKEGNERTRWEDRVPLAYWRGNPNVCSARRDLLKCNVSDRYDWNTRLYIQVIFTSPIYPRHFRPRSSFDLMFRPITGLERTSSSRVRPIEIGGSVHPSVRQLDQPIPTFFFLLER